MQECNPSAYGCKSIKLIMRGQGNKLPWPLAKQPTYIPRMYKHMAAQFALLTEAQAQQCCDALMQVALEGSGHMQLNAIGMVLDRLYGRVPLGNKVTASDADSFGPGEIPPDIDEILQGIYGRAGYGAQQGQPGESFTNKERTNQPIPTPADYEELLRNNRDPVCAESALQGMHLPGR